MLTMLIVCAAPADAPPTLRAFRTARAAIRAMSRAAQMARKRQIYSARRRAVPRCDVAA